MLGIELVIRSTVQSIRTLLNVTGEVIRKRKQSRNRRRIEIRIELQSPKPTARVWLSQRSNFEGSVLGCTKNLELASG